ncbi:MAG: hypothetical protein ACTSU5_08840 [Promethearchaeota archaeon]
MSYRRGLQKGGPTTSLSKKYRTGKKRSIPGKRGGTKVEGGEPGERGAAGKKKHPCSIKGCKQPAERSLSKEKYEKIMKALDWKLKDDRSRRLYICRLHYKDLKKKYKRENKYSGSKFGPDLKKGALTRKNPLY